MAIAGYTPLSSPVAQVGSYNGNVLPLLKDFVGTDTRIGEFLEVCRNYDGPALLQPNGTLDVNLMASSSGQAPNWDDVAIFMDTEDLSTEDIPSEKWMEWGLKENETLSIGLWFKILLENGAWQEKYPVHDTFIDGKYTLFIGTAAVRFFQQELMGQQTTGLQPPILLLINTDAMTDPDSPAPLDTINFMATFMTKYAETDASNSITITCQTWTYVKLDIDDSAIPSYVTSVKYHRSFGGVYFPVVEVPISVSTGR